MEAYVVPLPFSFKKEKGNWGLRARLIVSPACRHLTLHVSKPDEVLVAGPTIIY